MKTKKKENFDEQMKRLEEIVELLDTGEKPLEEQLELFEEGMALAANLREYIEKAELKVIEITNKKMSIEED